MKQIINKKIKLAGTKQQTVDALKKSRKISEFIMKKNTGRVFIASIDELIKDILEVIKKEFNVKLEQMAAVKELEKNLKANKYIHKVDNVLSDLESKERTLGFFESLGVYSFKGEIRMCKRLFYICYKNLWILYEFCTFVFWCPQLQIDIIG
ncbi:hypothetical protein PHYBLDRAFT_170147 [Phycomyces blakesleeanus NRRL 1555(-)]|uniref:Uncharacterized protein n=1 Tax=Phycomyces blakesleeanus (strain ATCC 8743b / DSM 1359 / FGSC 10004 / NBRC 33097 / NRRL 1555) TaxID=763407 RepID=A0A163DII5_PHYB8|nr:hypothetical protein PHYBLDRAFT_170147 [Phycomyces blakesleeanus NRRL 1555(-)]OAD71470.1 hypothetical protein PHYBLDRAFT_170147 [Phycomyces blakesleeanus NRRL 1555(-)]|eukprot:XP_018289510.1 hypothetical protein PHYBLDRAFT_170147 [Phycomyces blakesleeanus NRRL 1555(-)]